MYALVIKMHNLNTVPSAGVVYTLQTLPSAGVAVTIYWFV